MLMRPLVLRVLVIAAVTAVTGCEPKHVATPPPIDQGSFLVHRVTRNGETVRALSKWYAGSEKPAKEIARVSNVGENAALKPGQRILIPISYAKKKTPPPKPKAAPKAPPPAQAVELKESSDPKLDVEPATATVKVDPPSAPSTNPDKAKPVESFEELLLKEQSEVERLRQEMLNAPAAEAQN
jgi:hypothetical protein